MPSLESKQQMPIPKAQEIMVAHLNELLGFISPEDYGFKSYEDATKRLETYTQIAEAINTFDLPESAVHKMVETIALHESQLRRPTLLNNFFHDHELPTLAEFNHRDEIYDNLDQVLSLFPQTRSLLQEGWNYKSLLKKVPTYGRVTIDAYVSLSFLLLTRHLKFDTEEQEAEAEFFLHDFLVLGDPIGVRWFHGREDQIQTAVQAVITEWNIPQERVTYAAQTVMDTLFQGKFGNEWSLWHLQDIYDRVAMVVEPGELDWKEATPTELLRAFQETFTQWKKDKKKDELEEILEDQLEVANAIAHFAHLDTRLIAHDALRIMRNEHSEDALFLKLDIIDTFVPAAECLPIKRSLLAAEWRNRFQQYMSPQYRTALHRIAEAAGFHELASRIEAEGYDNDTLRDLQIKIFERNDRRQRRQQEAQLAAAESILRKN